MQHKVFLDPGHGSNDSGAVKGKIVEKNLNLTSALECKKVLESHGVLVKMSRMDDKSNPTLTARCNMANNWGANYLVSIHNNSGVNGKQGGVEAIHSVTGGEGITLAKSIVNNIHTTTGQVLRPKPVYSRKNSSGGDYYGMIRHSKMKAVIVECAFVDGTDVKYVDTTDKQKLMGVAIAKGILEFLKIPYKDDTQSSKPPQGNNSTTVKYKICLGSFKDKSNATKTESQAKSKGIVGVYMKWEESVKHYRVYAGAYNERPNADAQLRKVKSLGYKDAFIVS